MWWLPLLSCRADRWTGDGPAIRDLKVEAVDAQLAARVTFRTSTAAVGAVQFGADGALVAEVAGPGGRTEHDIVVFGLFADAANTLVAVARDAAGGESRAREETFRAGPVLDGIVPETLAFDPAQVEPGFTLMDLFVEDDPINRAVLVDGSGRIVWLYEGDRSKGPGALDASVTPTGEILLGGSVAEGTPPVRVDLAGSVGWAGDEQVGFDEDGFQHHHLEQLADGAIVGLRKDVRDGVRGDRVVAVDPDGDELWRWSTWDWFETTPGLTEQTHLNWLRVDGDDLYVSDYLSSAIWRIDRTTGAPAWRLGWGGTFAAAGGTAFFERQHDPDVAPDGTWYVYDNGERPGPSRVVAYSLDEAAEVATEVWSFDGGTEWGWFTAGWGDVDVLANGNVLIAAGNVQVRRALEVTPAEEVVWAIEWPKGVGFYRAERIDPARWGWTELPD